MKTIKRNELYRNLSAFLRERGIELKDGTYANQIRKGCTLLTETINSAQEGLHQAKTQVGRKLDEVRQVIHEKTAPPPAAGTASPSAGATSAGRAAKGRATKARGSATSPRPASKSRQARPTTKPPSA